MKKICKKSTFKRGICLLLCLISAFAVVIGGCDKDNPQGGSTADGSVIDTQSFVFASGITISGKDISGMSFDEAFQAVEAVAEENIKDFTLKVTADEKEFEYTKSDFKWIFNTEEALMKAAEYSESIETETQAGYTADLSFEVDKASVTAIVDAVAEKVDVAAVNATFSVDGDNVKISKEKAGKQLDKDDLTEKITAEVAKLTTGTVATATVEAVVNEVEPEYNSESLDGEIKLIATYSTYSSNTANGNHNMELALEACDGSVINPGEVWSFNGCTGNSNLTSLGYLPATVIANGKYEQGVGGGLCQSSTTIYNAALLANMTVEERYCHQFQSSYVPAGRDATIDYPNLDLKLSNPTDYPMYMQCYMEGTKLTVNIFGWDDPSFDYIDIESSVYGATDEGYRASASRVYYLDDKEVKREELPSSWYDYPDNGEPETTKAAQPKETKPKTPKATQPKATQPKATKPKATTPKATQAPQTKPVVTTPVTPLPSDPVEVTTVPKNTQATEEVSNNDQQIPTAIAQY